MSIKSSDIVFVYSGGSDNSNPLLSIGGLSSSISIPGNVLDNLFSDITVEESASGLTDFRCFYVFNDSATNALYNAKALIPTQVPDGSTVTVGFFTQDDQQEIMVQGNPIGGTMTLMYDSIYQTIVNFDPDPAKFATNVQNGLNQLGNLSTVNCIGSTGDHYVNVKATFANSDGNRYHPLLVVLVNSIVGATSIETNKIQDGGPINSIAPLLTNSSESPSGVQFSNYGMNNPFILGNFYPGDGFPVWSKRITPKEATGIRGDGFTFRLIGSPVEVTIPSIMSTFSQIAIGGILVSGQADDSNSNQAQYFIIESGGFDISGGADEVIQPHGGNPVYHVVMTGGLLTSSTVIVLVVKHYLYSGGTPNSTVMSTCTLPVDLTTLTLTDLTGDVVLTNDGHGNFIGCDMRQVAYNDIGSIFVDAPVVYTFFCAANHYFNSEYSQPPPLNLRYPVEWRLRISYPIDTSKPPGSKQGAIAGYTCATYHTAPDNIDNHAVSDPIDAFYFGPASLPVEVQFYQQNTGHWTSEAYYHLYDTNTGLLISPDPGIIVNQSNIGTAGVNLAGSALAII